MSPIIAAIASRLLKTLIFITVQMPVQTIFTPRKLKGCLPILNSSFDKDLKSHVVYELTWNGCVYELTWNPYM